MNNNEDLKKILNELKNNKNGPIYMNIPSNIESKVYWSDLRHIKKTEEATYNGAFDYANKHISDIHTPIFRDFARIFAMKNAKRINSDLLIQKYKNELEDPEMQKWYNLK